MFKRNDRGGKYYIQENGKNNAKSLGTTDETEAQRLLDSENSAMCQAAALNLDMGKTYIRWLAIGMKIAVFQGNGAPTKVQRCSNN